MTETRQIVCILVIHKCIFCSLTLKSHKFWACCVTVFLKFSLEQYVYLIPINYWAAHGVTTTRHAKTSILFLKEQNHACNNLVWQTKTADISLGSISKWDKRMTLSVFTSFKFLVCAFEIVNAVQSEENFEN